MLSLLRYESLWWRRRRWTESERHEFDFLDHEDERIGQAVAGFWYPLVVVVWIFLLLVSAPLFV